MITGGFGAEGLGAETSTEIYFPHTGKTCSLANLPNERLGHTANNWGDMLSPILCGGGNSTCLKFNPSSASGMWVNYNKTMEERKYHTSWVFSVIPGPPKLFLFGGTNNEETAELVNESISYKIAKSR